MGPEHTRALSTADIDAFLTNGFVRIDRAFSPKTTAAARTILWQATDRDPQDRSTWTRSMVRLGHFDQLPFREAANTLVVRRACDQLLGPGYWLLPGAVGTFPIRFPSTEEPGDDGSPIDVSFGDEPDFLEWGAQRQQAPSIANDVLVLGCRTGRRADTYTDWITP